MSALTVRRNADGTLTLRNGGQVATVDVREASLLESYEAIRWAAIGLGATLTDDMVSDLLREAKGLKD